MKPKMILFSFLSFAPFIFLAASLFAQPGLNVNDSTLIFKDSQGKIMSKDSVLSFVTKGPFMMVKKERDDKKTEIALLREPKDEARRKEFIDSEQLMEWSNKPFPDFELPMLDGSIKKLADLKGKILVINFWFTGCQPCIEEMPALNRLVNYYKDQPIEFLAFSFNDNEDIKKFLQKHSFKYVQFPSSKNLIDELGIRMYPTHMIVDHVGIISEIKLGAFENIDEELKILIEKVSEE